MEKRIELVKIRLALGLAQQQIADRAGMRIRNIFRLENGHMPRPNNIPRIARAYEITPQRLVELLFQ